MNIVLWIAQGLLAAAMLAAGTFKIVTPHDKLSEKMKWAVSWPAGRVKLLGAAEVLGAIGCIAPVALGILPILTPLAAACLFILMVGAVKTHLDLKEPAAPPGVLAALCMFVAVGRSGILP